MTPFYIVAVIILSMMSIAMNIGLVSFMFLYRKRDGIFTYTFLLLIIWQILIALGVFLKFFIFNTQPLSSSFIFILFDRFSYLLIAIIATYLWVAIRSVVYPYNGAFAIFIKSVISFYVACVSFDLLFFTWGFHGAMPEQFFSASATFIPFVAMMAIVSIGLIVQPLLLLSVVQHERSIRQMLLLSAGTIPLIITIFIVFFFSPVIFDLTGLAAPGTITILHKPFQEFYSLWFIIFSSLYSGMVIYSVIKHSLFDVRIVFRKETIRLVAYCLVGVGYLTIFGSVLWSINLWSVLTILAYLIFFAFSVLLIDFLLQRFMQKYLHSRFYYGIIMQPSEEAVLQKSTRVETVVRQLVGDMYKTMPTETCIFYTRQNDVKGLILKYSTVAKAPYFFPAQFVPELFKESQWLCVSEYFESNEFNINHMSMPLEVYVESLNSTIIIPLFYLNDYPIAVLCIGRRLDGKSFFEMNKEDVLAFNKFLVYASSQIWAAMSLENTVVIGLRNRIAQDEYII